MGRVADGEEVMTTSFEVGTRAGIEKVAGPWDWFKSKAGKVVTHRDEGANVVGRFLLSSGNQAQASKAVSTVAQDVMTNIASPGAVKGMSDMASNMSASAVKSVMTPENKKWFADATSQALDQTLNNNRKLIADVANEAVSKSLSPDNASKLIGQTLTRSWRPLAVAGMGAGVMLGAGAGIGIALGNMAVNRSKSFREKTPVVKNLPVIGLAPK